MENEKRLKIEFTVPGEPTGKARPNFARTRKGVKTYTPEKTENYEVLAKWLFQQSAKGKRFADNAMLAVRIYLYYAIPRSASKKKKELMLKGRIRPTKRPDIDNVEKIILDALNEVAYRDDKQVVDCIARKFYAEIPRTEVLIQETYEPDDIF